MRQDAVAADSRTPKCLDFMEPETTARRGCLFYLLVIGGFLLAVVLVATIAGVSVARKMLNEYTDTQPAKLPSVALSQAEKDALQERLSAFQQGIRLHRATPPLVLTPDEINALLESLPAAAPLRGKVFFKIEGDQLQGDLSVPMETLGLPIFRGRYLNGTATFRVHLQDGRLEINAQSLRVKGKAIPNVYMNRISQQNLAEQIDANPRASMAMDQLEAVRIENGKLMLVPRDWK